MADGEGDGVVVDVEDDVADDEEGDVGDDVEDGVAVDGAACFDYDLEGDVAYDIEYGVADGTEDGVGKVVDLQVGGLAGEEPHVVFSKSVWCNVKGLGLHVAAGAACGLLPAKPGLAGSGEGAMR